jgi:hypothetical protein
MKGATQKRLRNLHNWFGLFFAPGLIFFALSGALQTLGLHESGPGRQPAAAWIGVLASVHQEGEAALPERHAPPVGQAKPAAKPAAEHDHDDGGLSAFKIYVLLLSVSLIASAGTGIAIALANPAARRRTLVLLALGCVVPVALLLV